MHRSEREELKGDLACHKVLWDKCTNKLYLIYLYTVPRLVDPDPDFAHKRIVATAPGCSPFQAWYSPTSGSRLRQVPLVHARAAQGAVPGARRAPL